MRTNFQPDLKDELISLLLADMRSRKLIMGLDATGLSTDDFNTNLSELIFEKIGIAEQHKDAISNWYEDAIYNLLDIELYAFREHQLFLAITLYDALQNESRKLQIEFLLKPKREFSLMQWKEVRRFDN